MEMLYLNWVNISKLCKKLAKKVAKYKPDILIGISRGGLIPVRLLSDFLYNHNIAVIRVEFYNKIGKTKEKPKISQPLAVDVKGKRILLVDDIADSGKSLITAYDHVLNKGAREIRTATLHYKIDSKVKPDYFVEITNKWIVYPWEIHETEGELKLDFCVFSYEMDFY